MHRDRTRLTLTKSECKRLGDWDALVSMIFVLACGFYEKRHVSHLSTFSYARKLKRATSISDLQHVSSAFNSIITPVKKCSGFLPTSSSNP
jgi:hypothetical protein